MNSTVLEIFRITHADAVVAQLPLLASPWPMTYITIAYLIFVLKAGKLFMQARKPYNLKNVILGYNLFQMLYNGFIFLFSAYYLFVKPVYDLRCMNTLPAEHAIKPIERFVTYAYYINKLLDFLDTVFFVLRKSYKQITFLHVYHHAVMFYAGYWIFRFYGMGGQFAMMGLLNSFVHTVMYFYYFTSAMYPHLKGNLWWKKYITRLQILQFLVLFCQALFVLVFNPSCQFPRALQCVQLAQATILTFMFSRFYVRAYAKPKQQ
ncbi:elongation of very long chain fatty acids protein F-like [Drosophila busckii]|uniref:elongation of very long chain fatty acids protein F-like n=1 Tax=Drosophila busckii TaxID=30019 RepID=UPI00083F2EEA|nr:elongation of very long chain fatty acids protein F-like [Drosophila busckii]